MSILEKKLERNSFSQSFWNKYFGHSLLNDFFDEELPAINVKESKKNFKLEISVPGFDKEDVKLKVDRNVLTISAQRGTKTDDRDDDERLLRQEFSGASFYRSLTLPGNIDMSEIKATQKAGVLTITLPKLENAPAQEEKKKMIQIG